MSSEAEVVRDILNGHSTIEFRIDLPGDNRLLLKQRAAWFVWSTDFKEPGVIGPLKAAWRDKDGMLWLESSKIDDMMSLVEREYGEKGVHEMLSAEPHPPPTGDLPVEVVKFPAVFNMLRSCEKRIADISEKSGVPLEVLYDGGEELGTFRIGARIEPPPADQEALKLKMLMAASVLKEAHNEIVEIVWPQEDAILGRGRTSAQVKSS
jgi:hypothetical protein